MLHVHACESVRVKLKGMSRTCGLACAQIEVRDSRTGYFIPARYGIGAWPDGKIGGASSSPSASFGNSGRHSGQETIFGVFHMVLGSW